MGRRPVERADPNKRAITANMCAQPALFRRSWSNVGFPVSRDVRRTALSSHCPRCSTFALASWDPRSVTHEARCSLKRVPFQVRFYPWWVAEESVLRVLLCRAFVRFSSVQTIQWFPGLCVLFRFSVCIGLPTTLRRNHPV